MTSSVRPFAIALTVLFVGTASFADASTQLLTVDVILKENSLTVPLAQNHLPRKGVSSSSYGARSGSHSRNEIQDLGLFKSDYARSVALRAMLIDADQHRILDLLEQAEDIPNPSRKLATQAEIFSRFAVIDPSAALTHALKVVWNQRPVLLKAVFREWALSEFETATKHAANLHRSDGRVAFEAILQTRSEWSSNQILEFATQLGYRELGLELLEKSNLSLAVNDPQAAWLAMTTDNQDDDEQIQSLSEILERWCLSEGGAVILTVEDSISSMKSGRGVLYSALRKLAEKEPRATFDLVRSFRSHLRDDALHPVVSAWVDTAPMEALQAVSALEHGILRNSLIRRVASGWASEKPYELLQNLDRLPPDVQREAKQDILVSIVAISPEEAVKLMLEMPGGIGDYGFAVVSSWSRTDVRAALEWVLELDDSHRQELFLWLIHDLVLEDQELAFETALSLPIDADREGHEASVVVKIAEFDVEDAISMLVRVRNHVPTKLRAYSSVAQVLIRRGEADRAIELGRELSASIQEDYYLNLVDRWAYWDRVGLFESLDALPSEDLRTEAANQLLWHGFFFRDTPHRYFSEQQIEKIKAHISNQ
ncbi:MAG: hypothetical protein F4X44_02885 [Gammaproteobacteria bacterium]|nr:hypothetical protein [Gammaproteobacteria bacterium]MYD79540.1 hypothetical protein [Gammaproteobacteria bacterium]